MNPRYRSLFICLILSIAGIYVIPLTLGGYGLFLIPIPVFLCALFYGYRYTFNYLYFLYAVIIGCLYIPSISLFYNETAFIWSLVFAVIALTGMFCGRLFKLPVP